jgi:hypothetical protein
MSETTDQELISIGEAIIPFSPRPTRHSPRPSAFEYGDGQPVKVENVTEVQTFERFVAERQSPLASRAALLDYYRQAAGFSSERQDNAAILQVIAGDTLVRKHQR